MESVPEEVTHDEMVRSVMSDLVEHKLLSIHGLVVNEDSNEKEMQKINSEIVCQDFYVDANVVNSEKLKKAMSNEMDNLKDLKVFTDVDVKSLKSEEMGHFRETWIRWDIRPQGKICSQRIQSIHRGSRSQLCSNSTHVITQVATHCGSSELSSGRSQSQTFKLHSSMHLWMSQRSYMSSLLRSATSSQRINQRFGDSIRHSMDSRIHLRCGRST
eukprot:3236506-Amphidinium_carterae.1